MKQHNHSFEAAATLSSLQWGCRADWYIPDNVDACKENVPWEQIGRKMWPRGWFAVVNFVNYDESRDFGVNEKGSRVVAGPFATEAEALSVAEANFDAVKEQLTA